MSRAQTLERDIPTRAELETAISALVDAWSVACSAPGGVAYAARAAAEAQLRDLAARLPS